MSNTQQLAPDFQALGFEIERTQDGSPTLRLIPQGESMHHSGGAASETIYIYGGVLETAHQILRDSCKTCVVGLGLGYIEICWALSLLKAHLKPSPQISFHSFELVPGLIENFKTWINTDHTNSIYDDVVAKLNLDIAKNSNTTEILNLDSLTKPTSERSSQKVKAILRQALQTGSTLNGDFLQLEAHSSPYHVICYDAFSRKTSEDLWQASFLESFFGTCAAADCVVTTYACTGILRQTLQEKNFSFFKRPGFCGKRDSTLATRGCFDLKNFLPTFQTSSCSR